MFIAVLKYLSYTPQVLSFTHPVSFHSAETFESLLGCLKMDDEKVAEAALQIFKNTGNKLEESFPHIKSYVSDCITGQKSTIWYSLFQHAALLKTVSQFMIPEMLCHFY